MLYLLSAFSLLVVIILLREITKLKKMSQQNSQLRAVVENQNDFTFLVNRDFEVKATNLTYRINTPDGEPNVLGNVLHCKNAHHVGRCGEAEACSSCPLRFVITKSFERESGFSGVNACMEVFDNNEKLVDVDVQVEGHYVNLGHQGHMVINVKDKAKQSGKSLPKVLLITDNMPLYDKVREELSNEFRVLGADNEHQAFHRLQMADDYKFKAVLTDKKFFEQHKDVLKLVIDNGKQPFFVFVKGNAPAEESNIRFISEQIDGRELAKLLIASQN